MEDTEKQSEDRSVMLKSFLSKIKGSRLRWGRVNKEGVEKVRKEMLCVGVHGEGRDVVELMFADSCAPVFNCVIDLNCLFTEVINDRQILDTKSKNKFTII